MDLAHVPKDILRQVLEHLPTDTVARLLDDKDKARYFEDPNEEVASVHSLR